MDRLPALIVVVVALAGACDKTDKPPPGESRVNGAKVTAKKTDTAAFCDKQYPVETAPVFQSPALADDTQLPPSTKWRWINVWATWCEPCIDELPRLAKWQQTMPFELQLVSMDESDQDIEDYRKLHPEVPTSKRLAKPGTQDAWYAQLGLEATLVLPLHVFVDAGGRVRCVRAGSVREQDRATVEAVLAGK